MAFQTMVKQLDIPLAVLRLGENLESVLLKVELLDKNSTTVA